MLGRNIRLSKVSCERTELHPYLAMMRQCVHKFLLQKYKYVIRTNGSFQRENAGYSVLIWYDTKENLARIVENEKHPLKRNMIIFDYFTIMLTNSISIFFMENYVNIIKKRDYLCPHTFKLGGILSFVV